MNRVVPIALDPEDARWPRVLARRLGNGAPRLLWTLGKSDILRQPKVALFCSARCLGEAILRAYDQAAAWRHQGRCVIGGFHSPVEKECLRILLRGPQPVIICPARSLEGMRVAAEWKRLLAEGRLLLLSPFASAHRRATAGLAARRNELVAALADEVWFAHVEPGGHLERLARFAAGWQR